MVLMVETSQLFFWQAIHVWICSGIAGTALRRQGRSVARAKSPRHRRPRLRHRTRRRGAASAASRPPQARARSVVTVCLSAQPLADRSVQRLIPRCRWTVPTHWWAARPRSCPTSARQRTQTATAPCLTSSPPGGSQGRHRRRCALSVPLVPVTPHPSHEGVSRIAPAPEGARTRLADLAWADVHPGGWAPPDPCQPQRSVVRSVFDCRAVCRGSGRGGRLPMAWEASRVDAARGPLPWPAAGRCGSSCWKATQGTLRSLLRQGPRGALPSAAGGSVANYQKQESCSAQVIDFPKPDFQIFPLKSNFATYMDPPTLSRGSRMDQHA